MFQELLNPAQQQSFVPRILMVEGENDKQIVLWPPRVLSSLSFSTHTHTQITI